MTAITGTFQWQRDNFLLDVAFTLPADGITVIFGPSGSGKTSLLRCIAGLDVAEKSRFSLGEDCWQETDTKHCLPVWQRPIGYVPQEPSLFPHLTVKENILYGYKRVEKKQKHMNYDEVIESLQLSDLICRKVNKLSGGGVSADRYRQSLTH